MQQQFSEAAIDLDDDAALAIEELLLGNRIIISNNKTNTPFTVRGKFYSIKNVCYIWVTNDERRRILKCLQPNRYTRNAKNQLEKLNL